MTTKKELQKQIETLRDTVAAHKGIADDRQRWENNRHEIEGDKHKRLISFVNLLLGHLGLEIEHVKEEPAHDVIKEKKK